MEYEHQKEDAAAANQETIFTEEEFSLQRYDKHIRQARNCIFVVAGIVLLNLIILCFNFPSGYDYLWVDLSVYGLFIAGFVALGFWTKKKPYHAIIGALILYGLFIALNAYIDISSIWKGLIFKVFIIVYLFKGLSDAKEAQYIGEQVINK